MESKIKYKINISTTSVGYEVPLSDCGYDTYSCRNIETCGTHDCDLCIFYGDNAYTLEELKDRLMEGW